MDRGRDVVEQVKELYKELEEERETNKTLKLELEKLRDERDALKRKLHPSQNPEENTRLSKSTPSSSARVIRQLSAQLANLCSRYDDLVAFQQRQEALFKEDYSKWREFKRWLFDEHADREPECWFKKGATLHKDGNDWELSANFATTRIWKKREMLIERRRERKGKSLENKVPMNTEDKENISPAPLATKSEKVVNSGIGSRTPLHDRKRRRLNEALVASDHSPLSALRPRSPLPPTSSSPRPGTLFGVVASVPVTPFPTDSSPTVLGSALPPDDPFSEKPFATPCPIKHSDMAPLGELLYDEQRPVSLQAEGRPTPKRKSSTDLVMKLPSSSDTEDDSLAADPAPDEVVAQDPPAFQQPTTPAAESVTGSKSSSGHPKDSVERTDRDGAYPMNPLEGLERVNGVQDQAPRSTTAPNQPGHTCREQAPESSNRTSTLLFTPSDKVASSTKRPTDYSAYKGRGRYAQQITSAEKTINALYAIDPARNDGRDFQYDEVVRVKEDRRRLHAEDCECCHDYYEAVGPMPNRLQPPLWRSPSSTPVKNHNQRISHASRVDAEDDREDIVTHKQAISRHRQRWTRAQTPPGYWNIGFPTTQEAQDINQQAQQMHEAKQRGVNAEAARSDGRYTRR